MNYKDFFKGKKVTQLGLGLLGRGLGDALFMLQSGVEELTVTDKKTEEELRTSVEKLAGFQNLTLHLGGHTVTDFEDKDFILKGAGVPLDSEFILHAREKGIPIEMDSSLFVKLLPPGVRTVGVTGTRGKSTTTHLIAHILRLEAGKGNVFVGGNIRDMATLPLLKEVEAGDIVVLELDSWQLQGFGEGKISPDIAVFTTFMSDHMNYYGGDMEKYFDDKANIFKYQKPDGTLVLGDGMQKEVEGRNCKPVGRIKIGNPNNVPQDWKIKIPGEHNLLNIACALEACRALGASEEKIKEGVESFEAVQGRLEFVKEENGVKIWNDNNATTPEAGIAALRALSGGIVLLCGGADKNVSLEEFANVANERCKEIVLLPGTGTEKLKPLLHKFTEVKDLEEGVQKVLSLTKEGDNFLFSPVFASFGLFKNEYDRNDQFLKIVGEAKK